MTIVQLLHYYHDSDSQNSRGIAYAHVHTNHHTHIATCVNSRRSVNKMASDSTSDVALDCELEVLPLEGSKHDV